MVIVAKRHKSREGYFVFDVAGCHCPEARSGHQTLASAESCAVKVIAGTSTDTRVMTEARIAHLMAVGA